MSEELPEGAMTIDDPDDGAPASPPPVQSAPVDPPAPPADPAQAEAEIEQAGNHRERGLLGALKAERARNQSLATAAQERDQLLQRVNELAPYEQFLKANPALMQPRAPEPPPTPPQADPDAVEAAQLMDFYKADGTLDVDRGAKYLALQDRRAGRVTSEAVRPFHEQTLRERSTQNFAKALQVKDASGNSPSPQALKAIWQALPESDTANPEVAAFLAMTAMGADRMTTKPAPAVPPPVVHTEGLGSLPRASAPMSRFEENLARTRGLTADAWQQKTAGYVKGQPQVLEND